MLCRVFHRGKAENRNDMNYHLHDHQSMQFNSTANNNHSLLSSFPRVFCNSINNMNQVSSVSSGFVNINSNPTSLLHLLQCDNTQDMIINDKVDDVCSFFWDANLEDSSFADGVEEMKFDGDSTMIFQ